MILLLFLLPVLSTVHGQIFNMLWQTDPVFKVPESVYYDEARDQIYVSNINGDPSGHDGNGFLSLLSKSGQVKALKWVTGMDAPKGIAMVDSLLYVTDIDRFHIINIENGNIVKTVKVDSAVFMNDIAISPGGKVYISDTYKNRVLLYDGDTVQVFIEGMRLNPPTGWNFLKISFM